MTPNPKDNLKIWTTRRRLLKDLTDDCYIGDCKDCKFIGFCECECHIRQQTAQEIFKELDKYLDTDGDVYGGNYMKIKQKYLGDNK